MSISPQSLAKTRDKRSLRIPARYDDFIGGIPPEANYRNVAEALKAKGKPVKRPASHADTNRDIDELDDSVENMEIDLPPMSKQQEEQEEQEQQEQQQQQPQNPTLTSSSSNIKSSDDNVIKKSPFQPATTVSNALENEVNTVASKPVNDKKSTLSVATSPLQSPVNLKSASKKKSKGFSLLPKSNGYLQINNNNGNINNNSNSNKSNVQPATPTQQQQQQQQQPPTTKYYNNLSQNMQYGTRLMLNEPIYLPRSVNTIAPITTTLAQIANQARKPPFLSKKAAAYIAYQDERKLDYLTSYYSMLIKITEYLDIEDLLNLRLVNKSWKAIIDSDVVWKKIVFQTSCSKILDWAAFAANVVSKHQTSELVFHELELNDSPPKELLSSTVNFSRSLQITIRTINRLQNRLAIQWLCKLIGLGGLVKNMRKTKVIWEVKVAIDDFGVAWVPLQSVDQPKSKEQHDELQSKFNLDKPLLMLSTRHGREVELFRIETAFHSEQPERTNKTTPSYYTRNQPEIELIPI